VSCGYGGARRGVGLGALEVIDVQTGTVISTISGFLGFNATNRAKMGPDGVLVINGNEAWVGDGDTTIKVVDIDKGTFADKIDISNPTFTIGTTRADEEAYDAYNRIILMTVPDGPLPYLALIDQSGPIGSPHKVLNYLAIPDGTNGGIEQPVWDPVTRKFYLNVPNSNSNPLGGDLYLYDLGLPPERALRRLTHTPAYETDADHKRDREQPDDRRSGERNLVMGPAHDGLM
jgi:hypothetical protein